MTRQILLSFSGIPRPVSLFGCGELCEPLDRLFQAWPHLVVDATWPEPPIIRLDKTKSDTYQIAAPWLPEPLVAGSVTGALCNLAVDLVNAYFRTNPSTHCLHAAAAEFAGGLVVFPNTNRTGKSVLMAGMAHAGFATHGDDLLAVDDDFTCMSFGIPPRLRKPLPRQERALNQFVEHNVTLEDEYYCYLCPRAAKVAPFGDRKPVAAVIVLNRQPKGGAELVAIDDQTAANALVCQQFMREGEAIRILEFSAELSRTRPCWRLDYAHTEDAVAVLVKAMEQTSGDGYRKIHANGATTTEARPEVPIPRSSIRERLYDTYVRLDDVEEMPQTDGVVLIGDNGSSIYRANRTAQAVWELLRDPTSVQEVVDLFSEAFPGESREQIAADILRTLDAMAEQYLVKRIFPKEKQP